ncbi:MAG TPA: hypothetical protein VK949_01410 [Methylotenera sp.]|nr:hypothetical protein [Methylotenera sp.]
MLAFLYSATNQSDKLKEIDKYGWKKLKLQNYAESYIMGMQSTDAEYQSMVEQAAKDFPNSVIIQKANLMLHSQSADRPNYLLKYVAAQFADVKNHLLGPYRLNDYMASLEYEINKPKGD